MADLDKLLRDALAATPGPWMKYSASVSVRAGDDHREGLICSARMNKHWNGKNMRHIANFDPPTAIALIKRLERAERALLEVRGLLHEAIEDEDFQPAYSQYNFMAGPALLGVLTRMQDAVARAALAEDDGDAST